MARTYVHPLPVRIWHVINAAGFIMMILTGTQIRYVGLLAIWDFRTAVTLHNWTGFILIANYFVWLLFYLSSERIRAYHPELNPTKHFRKCLAQLQYYGYGIFVGSANPHQRTPCDKFNALQGMIYQVVMLLLVPVVFLTGVLMWDVTRFYGIVAALGGIRVVDTLHVLTYTFFISFITIHIYMNGLGHTRSAHFQAMFRDGYEEDPREDGLEGPDDTPAPDRDAATT